MTQSQSTVTETATTSPANGAANDETVIEMTVDQQNAVIRTHKFNEFLEKYQALSQFVNTIPMHEGVRSIVIKEFDTGFLWVKEAFSVMTFVNSETTPAKTN